MFTVVAFSESIQIANTFTKIKGVIDQHIKVNGDQIVISGYNNLIGAAAFVGTTGAEARLVSPSLRRVNPFYITPITLGLVPGTPIRMLHLPDSPIPLDINESIETEILANPGIAEQVTVAVFLSPGTLAPISGEIHTVNAEIELALVAGSWEFSEIIFPDSLPISDYAVVGARVVAAGGVVFRFVPVGEPYRPGGIVAQSVADKDAFNQRLGRLGQWFVYNAVQPPAVEILASASVASATYQIYMDVIKL